MTRSVPVLLAALAALAGCRTTQRSLADTRQELRQTLDGLYAAYGGSEVTPREPAATTTGSVVEHAISEADRSYFERQCLSVGRGERPFSVSPKLQAFLDRPENVKGCERAARLEREVGKLEEKAARG